MANTIIRQALTSSSQGIICSNCLKNFRAKIENKLLKREGELIRSMPNCCNKIISGRNIKEWEIDNKNRYQCKLCEFGSANKEKLRKHFETKKHQKNKDTAGNCSV